MAVSWTRQQRQVIESRGRNLLVSAGAGSGKTAVLVERIIRRITEGEDPADIDRLLVMTFTRAAAAEMRERIQAAIEKKLEENPKDSHLQKQAVLVQYAPITTIDSFCLQLVREHFDRLDLDPAFRVADEGELLLMRGDVLKDLMEEYYGRQDAAYEGFVDAYASGKADGGVAELISQVYEFAQSTPWPEEWYARCRRELLELENGELEELSWMRFLLSDAARQAGDWACQLKEALCLCGEPDGPAAYLPMIREDLSRVKALAASCGSFSSFCGALDQIEFPRLAAIRQKDGAVDAGKKAAVSECRSRIKKAAARLKEDYRFDEPQRMLQDMEEGKAGILKLLELAEEFGRCFREKKKEKNIVDFHDMEHFALEILTDPDHRPGPVADGLSRQFEEILVDEYQDSNLVQEALVQCVCGERFGRPNVFMVGDVKQSIYRFRLARPELFLEKYRTYTKEESACQKIELHQNFRSRSEVLESVNACFYRLMTETLGGIDYTEEEALHAGAVFAGRDTPQEDRTELLLLDTSQEAAGTEDAEDVTARELEARMIAGRIRRMTDADTGIVVWDREEERYRRAAYGDIVILLRSVSGWAEDFARILMEQGIPAFCESRTGYFDTAEVAAILNFLAVLDNPLQDIPLAAVLRSPIGGITDAELAQITARHKKSLSRTREKGLYQAVRAFLEEQAGDGGKQAGDVGKQGGDGKNQAGDGGERDALAARLSRVMEQIEAFRQKARYLPLHELLYQIYDGTGYYRYASALPGGRARRANLDMLVEKAAAYEATSYRGVFHFIRYIEKLKKYHTDFGEAPVLDGGGNAVRIMSIHKSKGLEFPVVFVSGLGKNFNRQDTRGKVLIDADLGIATDYLDCGRRLKGPTLKKNALRRRMELEALGEELRVLYVAMTRAKEKLILTAACRNLTERMEKWGGISLQDGRVPFTVLTAASSFLDWILLSLKENPSVLTARETADTQLTREIGAQLDRERAREALRGLAARAAAGAREETEEAAGGESGSGTESIWERAARFRYPWQDDTILNAAMSVSELKSRQQQEEEEAYAVLPSLPVFMEKERPQAGGASRGTAYHRALELLPFETDFTEPELDAWLKTVAEGGGMTREAAALVRPADLKGLLDCDLGKRMQKAARRNALFREKPFVIGVPACETGPWESRERILIQGMIDAFFEEEGSWILVDYKTDLVRSPDELIRRYRLQLDYYERALRQVTGRPVAERYLYSFLFGAVRL